MLTVVIMKLITLLVYELFQYLHHPFLDMLVVEGKAVRRPEDEVRVKVSSPAGSGDKNKVKRGQTQSDKLLEKLRT